MLYLRVSTSEQSCSIQKEELVPFVASRNWNLTRIYQDKATGTNANRPGFKELMADARQRKFDVAVCWKLDRWARSLKDLVTTLQELSELNIAFVSLKDQVDLTTSAGRLMAHLLASFAEFEVSLIRSRIKAGLDNARRRGVRLGRKKIRDDAQIQALRAQGLSIRQIAKEIGLSTTAVQRGLCGARGASDRSPKES